MTSKIGKITSWNYEKGFGFITPNTGGKSVFFHINDFSKRHQRPIQGLSVNFNLSTDPRGRICATHVYPEKGHKEASKADKQKLFSIFLCSAFFGIIGGLVFLKMLPFVILGVYLVISALTFILYAKDKSAAPSENWRTSESTLHLFFSPRGG